MGTKSSLEAWKHVRKTLNARQEEVLNALGEMGGSGTIHGVADHLNLPPHFISGRFIELRRMGVIREFDIEYFANQRPRTIFKVRGRRRG